MSHGRTRAGWAALVLVLLAAAAAVLTAPAARAQTPPPPVATPAPLQPGDVVWTFAPEPPLYDERIAMALGTLMAPRIEDATRGRTRVVRVQRVGPGLVPGAVSAPDQVPLLFAAAGFPQPSVLTEVGRCKVWAAPPPVGQSAAAALEARPHLIVALGEALGQLGIRALPCITTNDIAEAHVLIWQLGQPEPAVGQRNVSTFLAWPGQAAPPPRQPGSSGGTAGAPGVPRAPATGNAGLQPGPASAVPAAAGLLVMAAVVAVARWRPHEPR